MRQCHFLLQSFAILSLAIAVPRVCCAASEKPASRENATRPLAHDEEAVPQSIFTVTTNSAYGRNPFFPNSTALNPAPNKALETTHTLTPVLNGLTPQGDTKYAIINGRTFAEGEEGDITSGGVHAKIRCVEIKTNSVVIEINGEQKELRLRSED